MTRVVDDVVLTLTRIITSVVTGQAAVTLELNNTPEKNTSKRKVVHAYIIYQVIHVSAKTIYKKNLIGSHPTYAPDLNWYIRLNTRV